MCSKFTLKTTSVDILKELAELDTDLSVSSHKKTIDFDNEYFPSVVAPVIVNDHGAMKLTPMKFALVPSWSTEAKPKFATHNARIETILDKPTWRKPFVSNHCVIPMTGFYESVYEGPLKGHVIKFEGVNQRILYTTGIYDFWQDKEKPENSFFSFSILTRDPSTFILDHGHDRTPIFIDKKFIPAWLQNKLSTGEIMKSQLLANAYHPELTVQIDRPLKAGWEKRI